MPRALFLLLLLLLEGSAGFAQQAKTDTAGLLRLDGFQITGNHRTRARILTRELGARPGDFLRSDSLAYYAARDSVRLQNLHMFTDVAVRYEPSPDSPGAVVGKITVKERWYIWPEVSLALADRNFNVWWTEQRRDLRRANLRLALTDYNFRGAHETLRLGAQAGYTERLAADYFRPYLDKKQRHGGGFSAGYGRAAQTFYTTDSNKLRFAGTPGSGQYLFEDFGVALSYSFRPGYAGKHEAEIKYRDLRVADTILELRPDFFGGGNRLQFIEVLYHWEHRALDNWIYPVEGAGVGVWGYFRKGFRGLDYGAAAGAEGTLYRKVWRQLYGSAMLRGRLSVPKAPPYYLRSALGTGRDYVRGYEYYVVDGTHFALGRLCLKYQALNKVIRNIPFRYLPTIPVSIYPKVFADGGWVHSRVAGNSLLNNRPLYSVGVGVDLVTAYSLVLRFEYAWNGLGERGFFFHPEAE